MYLYGYIRKQQITDRVIDMFMRISHDIVFKSERRVVKRLISHIKKVYGTGKILFDIAEACIIDPEQSVKNVIFPIANQKKLQKIIDPDNNKIKRIGYEVYLLKILGNKIKCREIWFESSLKLVNPDKDLPEYFDEKKAEYYQSLSQPIDADTFINKIQLEMKNVLSLLNNKLLSNDNLKEFY